MLPLFKKLSHEQRAWLVVGGLCLFMFLLNFKPSEPYLSEYLICNKDTQKDYCSSSYSNEIDCNDNAPCLWTSSSTCSITPCANVSSSSCGNDDYDYCDENSDSTCTTLSCYKHFTEDQVNNEIYPWATYAYLPFLLTLGPFAEIVSYRIAILFGILGRVITRLLLLYGNSLGAMQALEVTYALGSAAEDVLSAYLYTFLPHELYLSATAYFKASALIACVLSGILGDLLVIEGGMSLRGLMWISAASVWLGFILGLWLLQHQPIQPSRNDEIADISESGSVQNRIFSSDVMMSEASEDRCITQEADDNALLDETRNQEKKIKDPLLPPCLHSSKKDIFRLQLLALWRAVSREGCGAAALAWVATSAVYNMLYNYEVSIYVELAGSDRWNGSVLAMMLLTGSVGTMLPHWLSYKTNGKDQVEQELEDVLEANRLLVALILACLPLILGQLAWELVPSIACLAAFFACWQCANTLFYASLALRLARAAAHDHTAERQSSSTVAAVTEAPFSMAIVAVVAASVIAQVVLQAVLFSSLALSLRAACAVLVIFYCCSTAVYALYVVFRFGPGVIVHQWVLALQWVLDRPCLTRNRREEEGDSATRG
eukprot:scaffold978_cov172-Ochromonas_danica.AAC.19